MGHSSLFKGRHFAAEVILCSVRWYLRYILSYRDVEERSARHDAIGGKRFTSVRQSARVR